MKNWYKILALILTLTIQSGFLKVAVAVVAYPFPIEYKQPDGTVVTIKLKGDETINWGETLDDYTLLRNSKDGWEYAALNADGDLVSTGVLTHKFEERTVKENDFLKKIPKRLRYSQNQIDQIKSTSQLQLKSATNITGTKVFTPSGVKKLLMILIQYQDVKFSKAQSDFAGLMNTPGYMGNGAHGSVRDYFLETSYGQFDLTTDVAPHIYTAQNNMAYYGADVDGNHSPKAGELMKEAVLAADADGVDFSQYDNDGDGSVDGVYVVFAGYSQATGGPSDAIWPHAGGISPALICDGKTVSKYSCSNELTGGSGTNITTIGVICHEFGHTCGAPDYYDTDYGTNGQFDGNGDWDVMDVGLYNGSPSGSKPAHFNPFEKIRAGWVTPTLLTNATSLTIPDITTNPVVYTYNTTTADEYFLMENRQQTGFNTDVPGHGLLIYHYSKNIWDVSRNSTAPQGFYPVCANAVTNPTTTSDATSYGDISTAGCPFPGSSAKTSFTDETTPTAKSWAGNYSYKPITNITEDNTAKTVSFTFMGGNSCTPPTTQATNLTVTNIQENELTLNWTRGNGDKVLVLARRNSNVNTTPLNGTAFNANSSFGAGDLIDAGTYVVYNGTESSVTITDLLKNFTYYFAVFEYNTTTNCYLSPALTGSATTPGCIACVPTATTKGSFGITNVTFNTINNTSDYSTSAYTNYAETITTVTPGTTYPLSVSTYSYSDQSVYTKVWIDWNKDCTFQPSEEYDFGSNINEGVVTKQILVPENTYSGYVTMRIRTKYNSSPTSCGNNNYSETEDYTLKIAGGCTPPTIQASNFSATNIQSEQMTINWIRGNGDNVLVIARQVSAVDCNLIGATDFTANADFGTGAQIETGNYVVYNGTGNNVNVTGLLQNATYNFAVYEYNSTNCFLVPALTGSATTIGCSACIPTATTKGSFGITNVTFNTINNTSDYSALAYTNYAATSTNVTAGTTYTLSVSTSSYNGYSVYTKAWIDWNKDCTFQPTEEYDLGSNINVGVVTKQIQVPANAYSGYITMRIRTTWNIAPTSCGNNNYSEAEDYSLKIVGGCTPPTAQATNFSATNIQNEQATINWTRGNGDNVLVIARQGAAVDSYPIGVSDFTANALFGTGAQIGTGNYVVYNGAGTNVTVTGLVKGTTYYFAVYEYNSASCFLTPALTGNVTTFDEAIWTGTTSTDWFTTSNWNTGSLPTATTSVTIPSAPSNQPQISASGAVCKNITINNGATLAMNASTAYTLTVNGDWTNNGSFSRGIGTVSFQGTNTLQTINGSAITTFYFLEVKKGAIGNILEAVSPISLTASSNPLKLTSGTFKLSSASTISPFTSDPSMPNIASMWVNNDGAIVNSGNFNWSVFGQVKISRGAVNIGTASNNTFTYRNGGSLILEGGFLNISGRLRATTGDVNPVFTFNQSGGTLTVNTVGSSDVTQAPFDINAYSSFTMSGGTIVIQKASSNASDYRNLAPTYSVTGGTLQIGNASTLASQTIHINSIAPIYNLVINANNSPTAQLVTNGLTVKNDVTIAGGTLNANNLNLSIGGNWTNNGTFTSGTGTVTLNGTSEQNLAGNSANTFNNLTIDNGTGVTTSGSMLTTVNGTLLINIGKKLTIGSGSKLTVTNLTNNSDATGLLIKSDATGTGSLIAGSTSGNATVERYLTKDGWHLIASPVSGQTVGSFLTSNASISENLSVPGQHAMKDYNETTNTWNALLYGASTDIMSVGNGFSVWPDNDGTASFSGSLQSGNKDVSVVRNGYGWNCIGNPYTSAIAINNKANAASNFIDLNSTRFANSYAAIYIWEQGNSKYTIINHTNDAYYIPVGQGFFVRTLTSGNFSFTPALQFHQPGVAFKNGDIAWPEIKLTISLGNLNNNAIIRFNDTMSQGLDFGYDAGAFKSGFDVYTKLVENNGVDFGIQCLPLTANNDMVIPIGLESNTKGTVALSVDISNLPSDYQVTLEDRQTGSFTPVNKNGQIANIQMAAKAKVTDRFFIHTSYLSNVTGITSLPEDWKIYVTKGQICISGSVTDNATVAIYDLLGRKIGDYHLLKGSLNYIPSSGFRNGVYLMSIRQQRGTFTKKVSVIN